MKELKIQSESKTNGFGLKPNGTVDIDYLSKLVYVKGKNLLADVFEKVLTENTIMHMKDTSNSGRPQSVRQQWQKKSWEKWKL